MSKVQLEKNEMNYQEAIAEVQKDPKKSFIGLFIRPSGMDQFPFFGYYEISVPNINDPEWICISYEGAEIFDHYYCTEEDSYYLDDVPEETKLLHFKSAEGFSSILGALPEFALFELFPDLPDPEELWTDEEKSEFVKLAYEQVKQWAA